MFRVSVKPSPGEGTAYFKMVYSHKQIEFGEQVFVEFESKPRELFQQKLPEDKPMENESEIIPDKIVESVQSIQQPAKVPASKEQLKKSELKQSVMMKLDFLNQAEAEGEFKENLIKLMALGFADFDLCLKSLRASRNDIEKAIDVLLSSE